MNFLEKLDMLMADQHIKKTDLARSSGVPYTTIDGLYKKGYENTQISTIRKLAKALGVSVDYLIEENTKKAPGSTPEAMKVAREYEALPGWGQRWVRNTIRAAQEAVLELAKPEPPLEELEEEPAMKVVPLFQPFAAGPAEPDWDNPPGEYEVPLGSPADFAFKVNGTSMEPYLPDKSVQLGSFRTPGNGDVGAFVLGGEYLVKQYFRDMIGNVYLLSLNRREEDKDVTLWAANAEFRQLTVLGTIIMTEKPPLPKI